MCHFEEEIERVKSNKTTVKITDRYSPTNCHLLDSNFHAYIFSFCYNSLPIMTDSVSILLTADGSDC